jgi:prepilin-type N-terminal cleavage/methylation domain-containing protein
MHCRRTQPPSPSFRPGAARRRPRGFTLAEIAVVVAIIGVSLALGLTSMADMVAVQRKNAALAQANLTLREERARALETRRPRYVKPAPIGTGLVLGNATVNAGGTCVEGPVEQRVDLPTVKVTGDRVCFTQDGNTDVTLPIALDFKPAGGGASLASVDVFPAGTLRWSGSSLFQLRTAAIPSISVRNIADQTINPIFLQ